MRLRGILILSTIFMAILAGLIGAIGIRATQTIHREFEFVRNDLLPVSGVLDALRRAGMNISASAADFGLIMLASPETPAALDAPRKKLTRASFTFVEALLRYETMVRTLFPEEESFLAEVRTQGSRLQSSTLALMDIIHAGAGGKELLDAFHRLQERESRFHAAIEKALEHEKWELVETKDQGNDIIQDGIRTTIAATAAGIALALTAGAAFSGRLSRPLAELRNAAERFGRGELSARAVIRRDGEIGLLAQSFNGMADDLAQSRRRLLDGKRQGETLVILRDITAERRIARMKTPFISTAAHELSTPLTSILGYANLLHDEQSYGDFSDEQKRAFIAEVHDNAEYLYELTNKLLDLDRMENGQAIPLNREAVDLATLIGKTAHRYRQLFPDRSIEIRRREDFPAACLCDPLRISQGLGNLISNAIKYSPAGKTIRLHLSGEAGGARIEVEDEGRGMSAAEQARAFDPFYRADGSNTAPRGTGLGLCIVKNIVQAHGGKVWIAGAPGRGSRIGFFLPAS
ncbi:MAG: ATP-binding protein [Trichloromonas sp.]|jgi:signal transduction histidine kinase|nr:ATP-binding protein [Trichloromonas sp.]